MILDEIRKKTLTQPFWIMPDENYVKLSDIEKVLEDVRCEWKYVDDKYYDTSCKNSFQFSFGDGLLADNKNFKFCPYCGREIQDQFERKQ